MTTHQMESDSSIRFPPIYTNFELAFHLAHKDRNLYPRFGGERYGAVFPLVEDAKICDQTTSEHQAARKWVHNWIRRHPVNIPGKAEAVVEHFSALVVPLAQGTAVARIVTASPQEAVLWENSLKDGLASKGCRIHVETEDRGESLGRQIVLTAAPGSAESVQPQLRALYVDKKLSASEMAPAFSQLSRKCAGNSPSYIVDFANQADDVASAFGQSDAEIEFSVPTDPQRLFDLCDKLDSSGFYDPAEVNSLVTFDQSKAQENARIAAASAARRLMSQTGREESPASDAERQAMIRFKDDVFEFVRAYSFLSQLFNYRNTPIEKHALFFRHLLPALASTEMPPNRRTA